MKPIERILIYAAILCALLAALRAAPQLPAARADESDAPDAAGSVAVCNVWRLSYDMALSDRYDQEREEYEEIQDELTPLWEDLEAARERYEQANPDDENYDEIEREYHTLSQRYSTEYERLDQVRDRVFGEIVLHARDLVISSAEAIAEQRGYSYVVASHIDDRPREDEPMSYRQAWQRHVAEPLIVFPDAADITIDVRDDLNLD